MIEMVRLFTIDCPKCRILEKKLTQANIQFDVCKDKATMLARGFDFLPVLEVDGEMLGFKDAVDWINRRK